MGFTQSFLMISHPYFEELYVQRELTPYSLWLSILFLTKSKILYLKTWVLEKRLSENFKLFFKYNQGTQWEKLPTNQIHLVFQIPAYLVSSYTDKQKMWQCLCISLTNNILSSITKDLRSNFSLGFYGISLHLYKIMPRVFVPCRTFFYLYGTNLDLYSINQN